MTFEIVFWISFQPAFVDWWWISFSSISCESSLLRYHVWYSCRASGMFQNSLLSALYQVRSELQSDQQTLYWRWQPDPEYCKFRISSSTHSVWFSSLMTAGSGRGFLCSVSGDHFKSVALIRSLTWKMSVVYYSEKMSNL